MPKFVLLLALLSTTVFCSPTDTLALVPAVAENALRPGSWGIGLRPFGTTMSLLAYRAFTPRWDGLLRLSWNGSRTDQETPSSRTSSLEIYNADTTITSGSSSNSMVNNNRNVTAVLEAEYDLPTGHGVDFKAGFGPIFTWTWTDVDQSSTTSPQSSSISSSSSWTAGGGLRGTLGLRWWFVPQRLAIAGEFDAGGSVTYQATQGSGTSNGTYSQNHNSSNSHTWSFSTSTYTCSLGLDAFF